MADVTADVLRGLELYRARAAVKEKQAKLVELSARISSIAAEEARIEKAIAETKDEAREQGEKYGRREVVKKADQVTTGWVEEELAQRRQALGETRRQDREAIAQRRFALLKQKHDEFLAQKQEQEQGRAAILAARALKLEQARAKKNHLLKQKEVAQRRAAVLAKEHAEQAKPAYIEQEADYATLRADEANLRRLQAEEERLLRSIVEQHARHRQTLQQVQERVPAYRSGLADAPVRYAVAQPLAEDNVLLSRRPLSVRSRPSTAGTPRSVLLTAGNTAPSTPRSSLNTPRYGATPAATAPAIPRADLLGVGATPGATMPPYPGRACTIASPLTCASSLTGSRPSSARSAAAAGSRPTSASTASPRARMASGMVVLTPGF
jgi:hypothetical protein